MAAADDFPTLSVGLSDPARHAAAVTPHDVNELAHVTRFLWIGTGGDVKVKTQGGETVTLTSVPNGSLLPVRVVQVFSTGTTAGAIVSLY